MTAEALTQVYQETNEARELAAKAAVDYSKMDITVQEYLAVVTVLTNAEEKLTAAVKEFCDACANSEGFAGKVEAVRQHFQPYSA